MKQTYNITGMTCKNCVTAVTQALTKLGGVTEVHLDLEEATVAISMTSPIALATLNNALPDKYLIFEQESQPLAAMPEEKGPSKLQQLRPLLLIFVYLFAATYLLHYKEWDTAEAMLDFMGLFYIVFSFFKLLDIKGFPESFRRYDPLAQWIPAYAWIYPFLEVGLGLMFLLRFQIGAALIITLVVLGMTTWGVSRALLDRKRIRCACLGTALKLPMTEATFIENAIMLAMAGWMLFTMY